MDVKTTNAEEQAGCLRQTAEDKLRTGAAPASGGPLDAEALALLYDMASDPRRSSDALRLLQELQVYQVELDLQRAQLESNEREMSHELARYRALYTLTPAAALVVTTGGHIVDANPAATVLLGLGEERLAGQNLIDFLAPESRRGVAVVAAAAGSRRTAGWWCRDARWQER